jgi:hypothetical protein
MPDAILTFLANNAVGLVGIAITATLAYYFYIRGRRAKQPCWATRITRLVTDRVSALPGIDIRFNGEAIQQLAVSRVVFYNKGAETIRRADIPKTAPLRIVAADKVRMLGVSLLATNNAANASAVAFEANNTLADLTFDYLDQGDGLVVEVIHTGSEPTDIRMDGAIIGAKELRLVKLGTNRLRDIYDTFFVLVLLVGLTIFFAGAAIRGRIGGFVLGVGTGLVASWLATGIVASVTPRESVPKGLEDFSS